MQYSIIRFLPNPFTGEFRNIGAIVSSPDGLHLRFREHLLQKMPASWVSALHALSDGILAGKEGSLEYIHHKHRNVVQFSVPAAIAIHDPEEALDFLFMTILQPDLPGEEILVPVDFEGK